MRHKKSQFGFTLTELLIVVALIGILVAVIGINGLESGRQSRDAKRQADLRLLQNAVELYRNKNGEYPADGSGNQYIAGLAPEYISVLPKEPGSGGYVYKTNAAQSVYKIAALNTVESDQVDSSHEFSSCDSDICSSCSVDDDTYAVWGGFADGDDDTEVRSNTSAVICNNNF